MSARGKKYNTSHRPRKSDSECIDPVLSGSSNSGARSPTSGIVLNLLLYAGTLHRRYPESAKHNRIYFPREVYAFIDTNTPGRSAKMALSSLACSEYDSPLFRHEMTMARTSNAGPTILMTESL